MTTGSRHFECTFYALLSTDIREIEFEVVLLLIELLAGVCMSGLYGGVAIEEIDDFHQVFHTIDVEVVNDSSLANVLFGHDEALELFFAGTNGNGQGSAYRHQIAVESQFAHQHIAVEHAVFHFTVSCHDADGERQVVARALLLDIGRRQVGRDVHSGHLKAVVDKGCLDAVVTLTYRSVGQSRQVELHASRHVYFYGYSSDLQSVNCCTIRFYQHNVLLYTTKIRKVESIAIWLNERGTNRSRPHRLFAAWQSGTGQNDSRRSRASRNTSAGCLRYSSTACRHSYRRKWPCR